MIQSHDLFVLHAYDMTANGELYPAFEPRPMPSQEDAVREAGALAGKHDGVVVWKRRAEPAVGEFGPEEIVYQQGEIPEVG
jgi:hypothetical protein